MSERLRKNIYDHLVSKETEELLEIWRKGDATEWSGEAFEIVKRLLVERLGYVPPQIEAPAIQMLDKVDEYLDKGDLSQALRECESAIQLNPDSATAYWYRGYVYDEMGQFESAMASYRRAIQLDPELEGAWGSMLALEQGLEDEFQDSAAKQHLDQALEHAYNDEPERALAECDLAEPAIPGIAIAHNYLGMILETLGQLEPAIVSYLKATQLNPRFYSARENLANARIRLEEERYRPAELPGHEEAWEVAATDAGADPFRDSEAARSDAPVPGWFYLDARAYLLPGWAGHRTRPGRSGYDPLDLDFESAHMVGTIIRLSLARRFRTRNPVHLLLMACMGLAYCLPVVGVLAFRQGDWTPILAVAGYSPYWIVGIALLINVVLSLHLEEPGPLEDHGLTFFQTTVKRPIPQGEY